jgi:DNA-binding MarR family transcriptional regulator
MNWHRHTPSGAALSALILEVFRLNGRLLTGGDRLVSELGLTSARWQVLGAVMLSPTPEPVARLARNMGLNRQGVQRIVDEMAEQGLLVFGTNPHHRRARLVTPTDKGRAVYAAAGRLQVPWVNALAEGLDPGNIDAAIQLLEALRKRLEGAEAEPRRGG